MKTPKLPLIIDGLQYNNWSEDIFREMNEGGVAAVHVTICYHEDFQEMVENVIAWNRLFELHSELIFQGRCAEDVLKAQNEGRTAIIFGFQNCSPIEDDIGLVEICHQLGVRFMQLSYNNQSLLATGCYEDDDSGITRMGRQVIKEMNRVGLVVDMSHSARRSTLEAIEISARPIAITHANPFFWCEALRNKTDDVLKAIGKSGGMLGFSLYPHHLKDKSACLLEDFCGMIARTAEMIELKGSALAVIYVKTSLTTLLSGCVTVPGATKGISVKGLRSWPVSRNSRNGSATIAILKIFSIV